MKKNVFKVIALVIVAGMLLTFCSCTQKVEIRFVDKSGNDLDLKDIGANQQIVIGGGNAGSSSSGDTVTPPPADNTPSGDTTPSDSTPSGDTTPSDSTPSGDTTPASSTSGKPQTTAEIADFYKKAANDIKNNGVAGYTKKEWQNVDAVNISSLPGVNSAVTGVLGSFMTTEEQASDQVNEKGSDDAKNRFPAFTLTDYSKIASATCTEQGGNYVIKIVMVDEDTPKKDGSMLGQVTNSVLYWEDIDDTLKNDSTVTAVLKGYDNIHVIYKGYLIEAVMTPDGKFVSLSHTADVDIKIGSAKIIVAEIKDKSGHMNNYAKYTNFKY